MSSLARKSAVLAASAGLALAGIAAPVSAANNGHHVKWSMHKCDKKAARWEKAHKHPTQKQINKENKLLAKHGCTNTVS